MKVTKISLSNNRTDLYQIFLDNKFFCSISGNDLLDTRLAKGSELNSDQQKDLLYRSLKGKLTNSALNYLAVRPHSEFEIKRFVKKKLFTQVKETPEYKDLNTDQIIDEILSSLRSRSLVSDQEFTKWLVSARTSGAVRNPKSKGAIKVELQQKGIPNELITEALSQFDTGYEEEQAKTIAEKKLGLLQKRESDPNKVKIKLTRYLISKGYSWDTVRTAVDSLLNPF